MRDERAGEMRKDQSRKKTRRGMNRNRLASMLPVAVLTVVLCAFLSVYNQLFPGVGTQDRDSASGGGETEGVGREQELSFSAGSGFYQEEIRLSVSLSKAGSLYYTADGSLPLVENESAVMYEGPILIPAGEEAEARTLRFKAYFDDGTESEVVTNTYFTGSGVESRFDTLVMSVSGDPDGLYGYENGIFVEGKLRDDYAAQHPGEEPQYDWPANYNVRGRQSEREVGIEVFEPDGERIIAQNGGIRISGNFTRQSEQKSFKIYARREYDERNKFKYPFFDDEVSVDEGEIIDEFECLKIRNTGNDRSEAFIRDELGQRLAAQAGFPDVQYVRPVSVFINSVYQGPYWLHSTYDDEYFKERYGGYDGEMVVIGAGETVKATDSEKEIENTCAAEYMEIYDRYSAMDLTDDGAMRELNGLIDIDNYLRYFAIEVYVANTDWPFNNEQAYRYVSPDGDYQPDSVFDGRYRFLLYDIDTTMGHGTVSETINESQSFEVLKGLLEKGYAPLFARLMEREDCREAFVRYLLSLSEGAFSYENVVETLDQMHAERKKEMDAYIRMSEENPELPDISAYYTDMQMDCIKTWAKVTPDNLTANLAQLWPLGEAYTLELTLPEGAGALVDGARITDTSWSGRSFTGCDTQLTALVPEGRRFVCWEVDGTEYPEEALVLTEDKLASLSEGKLYVSLILEDDPETGLVIDRIGAKGDADYIVLRNPTLHKVDTWGYFLMDKDKPSHMNYLGSLVLDPGESIRIAAKDGQGGGDTYMRVNFNLRKGETLTLGHASDKSVEAVRLPDLSLTDGYFAKDPFTGRFVERRDRP